MSTDAVFPIGDAAYDAVYARERAMIDASELIASALEASGMSRAELARALGVSRAEITARLKGERNITVRTLAETLHALSQQLDLSVVERPSVRRSNARLWRLAKSARTTATRPGRWTLQVADHV